MSGDMLDARYAKYGDSPSNVAHIKPIQEAGDMLTAEMEPKRNRSVSVGTSTLFDSASGRFSGSNACLCPQCLLQRSGAMMRRKKSLTVLWERRWLATSSSSLWPRSVEATTDLRARHKREIILRKKFLLHGLFMLLKESRYRRYQNNNNRSQSELCLARSNSRAQQLRSIRSLTITLGSGSDSNGSRAQIEQTESQSEIITDDDAAAPLAVNAAFPPTAVVPPMRQLPSEEQTEEDLPEEPEEGGSADDSCRLLNIPSETPRFLPVKSKSADDLLHRRRGLRLKWALAFIGCRSLLRH